MNGPNDYFANGDWNVECSMCGRKRKSSQVVKNWQGMWRCPEHNEPRHPQDFAKGSVDKMTVPFAQPPPAETFLYICTVEGGTSIPGYAMPGCEIPGRLLPVGYLPIVDTGSPSASFAALSAPWNSTTPILGMGKTTDGVWIVVDQNNRIARSVNGGGSWNTITTLYSPSPGSYSQPIIYTASGVLILVSAYAGFISRSTDKGLTWSTPIDTGIIAAGLQLQGLVEGPSGTIVAFAGNNGQTSVSNNNGLTWTVHSTFQASSTGWYYNSAIWDGTQYVAMCASCLLYTSDAADE